MGHRYDHVSLDERCKIYRPHEGGESRRAIGRLLGRHLSTTGRELKRNGLARSRYKPAMAERMASARKLREPEIERSSLLKTHILDSLATEQSAERIARRLKLTGSEHTISTETIYAWTYITDKSADTTAQALSRLLEKIPKKAWKTLTLDNGGEFYHHKQLPVRTFFCDPHSPWQRSSVENANGVILRSLPRNCKLDNFSNHDIEDITGTYNSTPRKCLGFLTLIEACAKSIGGAVEI